MNLSYLISKWFLGLPPAPLSTFLLQKVLMTRGTHSVMMGASYKDGERDRKPSVQTFSPNSIQSTQDCCRNGMSNRITEFSHPLSLSNPIKLTPGKRYTIDIAKTTLHIGVTVSKWKKMGVREDKEKSQIIIFSVKHQEYRYWGWSAIPEDI